MSLPAVLAVWIAQTPPGLDKIAASGVLGALVAVLGWLLWQFLKWQRQDLTDTRSDLRNEQAAHNATREETAKLLREATTAMEKMSRRRTT